MFIQNREQCPSLNSVDMSPLVFTVAQSQDEVCEKQKSISKKVLFDVFPGLGA